MEQQTSYKLPTDFKEKWVAALRSGNYKQGTGRLVSVFGAAGIMSYCCLGVACKIAGFSDDNMIGCSYPYGIIKENSKAAKNLPEAFHLPNYDPRTPRICDGKDTLSIAGVLANLNDQRKWNFDQIADFIEQNL